MLRNGRTTPSARHAGRRAAATGTIVLALAAFLARGSGAVTVGAGTLGGFEADGNLVVDTAGNLDWGTPPADLVTVTDDTTDSGFQGSSKELKPSEWTCNSGGANPSKANLLRAYLSTNVVADTEAFLNVAWVRENASGQGDVHVNYEFNRSGSAAPAPTSGSCPIARVAGDLLVTYDFPGGAADPDINLYRWVPLASPTSAADGDWVDTNLPASAARAAVNQGTEPDPIAGGSIQPLRFGEATIDLTAALAAGGITDCLHFGVAHIRSRSSGQSWTSALQDNLPGLPVHINTCAATPAITTTATNQVIVGNAIGDVAHLSGGNDPTGTIVFTAFGPDDASCSNAPAFTSAPVSVNGNGDYTSPSFTDPVAGTYRWIASYVSANIHKNESVSGKCNDDGETTTVVPSLPHLGLDKKVNGADHASAGDALVVHVGDALHYTVDITNGGNVPLTISGLADSLHSNLGGDCDHGNGYVLGVGGTITCAYSTVAASSAHNVASVTGTPPVGGSVSASDGTFVTVIHPAITIVKHGPALAHVGDPVTYTFTVHNTGDVPLTNVSVDDNVLGHIGVITTLAVGETKTLDFTTVASVDVTNTADACGLDPLQSRVCDEDHHHIDVIHPAVTIDKTGPAQAHAGDSVTYHFAVHNTGDVALTNVSVDDDVLGHIGDIASLAVDETVTLSKTTTAPAADVRNVATVCGDDPLAKEVCGHDDHHLDIINPGIDVQKSGAEFAHEGDVVTYTFTVHNTGDVSLADVNVSDNILGAIGSIPLLDAGATTTLTKTMTVPASVTAVDNTATACGLDLLDHQFCDTDNHHLTVVHPGLTIDKKVAGADHKPAADALNVHQGDALGYTIAITNTGDTPLTISGLFDTLKFGLPASCSQGNGSTLAPAGVMTCTYTMTAGAGTEHNVASVTGTDVLGGSKGTKTVSDETFVAAIHPAIKIVKSANPKTVDPGQKTTYTYVVTNIGDTALTDVVVTDDKLGDIGTIASLAVGESKTLTKTVTIRADSPRTNIATACGVDGLGLKVCANAKATITIVLPVPPQGRTPAAPKPNLPATGFRLFAWLAFAMNLVAAGAVMMRRSQRGSVRA